MTFRAICLLTAVLTCVSAMSAGMIEGTITVRHKLTKRRVTASIPLYQRGPTAPLVADAQQDPLSYERARVVIYLEGRQPTTPMTGSMEQQNRRFLQDPVVIPAGSRVSFPNKDPIFHNVFSLSKTRMFDLGNYAKGETRLVTFNEPGVVLVNCHLHPNMASAIVVTPNQWFAKADATGHFSIPDVPPGSYTVVAWHKSAGFFRKKIEVTSSGSTVIDFFLPLNEQGFPETGK